MDRRHRQRAQLLAFYLDILEKVLRRDLNDRRITRKRDRGQDLTDALEALANAREELARRPSGAHLALLVNSVALARLRHAVELADSHHKAARQGWQESRPARSEHRRRRRLAGRDEQIRAAAAELDPEWSVKKKAEHIARHWRKVIIDARFEPLSARRIRAILKTPTPRK